MTPDKIGKESLSPAKIPKEDRDLSPLKNNKPSLLEK
jgi:hypothetical protein